MKKRVLFLGLFLMCLHGFGQTFTETEKIVASDRAMQDEFGQAVAISGHVAVVGAVKEDEDENGGNPLSGSGSAYIYERNSSGRWTQVQKIVASDRDFGDNFGYSVAISGNYLVVTADREDHDAGGGTYLERSGSAYVFERDSAGTWNQVQKIVASDRESFGRFGSSVAIDGDMILVGAMWEDKDASGGNPISSAGAAYFFLRDSMGVWNQAQKLIASDREADDRFGSAVSINGNIAVVGAPAEDHNSSGGGLYKSFSGAAYIFERDTSGIWSPPQKVTASDRESGDIFGTAVSIFGTNLVIGAPGQGYDPMGGSYLNNAGAAYSFSKNVLGNWTQEQKFVPTDRGPGDGFGHSLFGNGGYLAISAHQENEDTSGLNPLVEAGSAYLFQRNINAVWSQEQKIVASDRAVLDHFGHSIAISGTQVIVSANGEDEDEQGGNTLSEAGSAYVFNYCSPSYSTIFPAACDSFALPSGKAVFYASGIYADTIRNVEGCDSVLTINLTVHHSDTSFQSVIACDTFTWPTNGTTYSSSGIYYQTLVNAHGCDSTVVLDLSIRQSSTGTTSVTACNSYTWPLTGLSYTSTGVYSGTVPNAEGCDSLVSLNLTINNSSSSTETLSACDSYTWPANGATYTSSGTYSAVLVNSAGCDSNMTLNLTIKSSSSGSETASACNNYTWAANGMTYFNSGNYQTVLTNAQGCDSVVTLNLVIRQSSAHSENVSACDSYTWPVNSVTYTSSGTYSSTLTNAQGCDSVVTLNLVVSQSSAHSETVSACDSYTWPANGMTYTTSGTYSSTLTNAQGCDSVVTLNLVVNQSSTHADSVSTCDSYTWPANSLTYTSSGSYSTVLTNSVGCDSVVTLDLVIRQSSAHSDTVSACDSYTWPANGMTYTTSGLYATTIANAAGCDSSLTLNLSITQVNTSITQNGSTLTSGAIGATYQWIECDSQAILAGETSSTFTATVSGTYAVIVTENGCSDTSACVNVVVVGLTDRQSELAPLLYPNPTQGNFVLDFGKKYQGGQIGLWSVHGKQLKAWKIEDLQVLRLTLDEPAGTYFLTIEVDGRSSVMRVVKE